MDLAVNTRSALEFHRLCSTSGNRIFIHPAIHHDLNQDTNKDRAGLRRTLLAKYERLVSPPDPSILGPGIAGTPSEGSNDWVDNALLASLKNDLVDYLVTEDLGIHKKARKLDIEQRVLLLNDAVFIIRDLFDVAPTPPPAVQNVFVYQLDDQDPIFDSLRRDYPEFDVWLAKGKRDQRKAYMIKDPGGQGVAALTIFKREEAMPDGTAGKILKLCTFKVSENHSGNRFGELLLKAIFDFMSVNDYEFTYFTVFPKHEGLIDFAEDFGFFKIGTLPHTGEFIYRKDRRFKESECIQLPSLDFHIRYGPMVTSFHGNSTFIVPIRPEYHGILFPEYKKQPLLFPGLRPCGNSIRKAYLSRSASTLISKGDNIVFYRSGDERAVTCLGIVEGTFRSQKANEVARYVGKRTVYSFSDIQHLCSKDVLAINFRHVRPFEPSIPLSVLLKNAIINGPPQSITRLSREGAKWIESRTKK